MLRYRLRLVRASAATGGSADASARRSSLALASADASTGGGGGGNSSNDGYILACGTGVEPGSHPFDSVRLRTWMVLVHRTDSEGKALWQRNYSSNRRSVFGTYRNNAGEYIVATREGGYAVYVDSQSCGNQVTGGNFALMLLGPDVVNGTVRPSLPIDGDSSTVEDEPSGGDDGAPLDVEDGNGASMDARLASGNVSAVGMEGTSPNDGTEHGDDGDGDNKDDDDDQAWARHRARHVLWLKQATAAAAALNLAGDDVHS